MDGRKEGRMEGKEGKEGKEEKEGAGLHGSSGFKNVPLADKRGASGVWDLPAMRLRKYFK